MTIAGYTYLELQEEVLSFQFSANKYRSLVKKWLNQAQRRAVIESEIRTQEEAYEFTTAAGTATYELPANFARSIDFFNSETHELLQPLDIREFDNLSKSEGRPYVYTVIGNKLTLYPTPNAAYPFTLRYWRLPADMINDTDQPEIPVQYQENLIPYAMAKAFNREDDWQAAQVWEGKWERSILKMRGEVQSDVFDGPRQVPGAFADVHGPAYGVWRG